MIRGAHFRPKTTSTWLAGSSGVRYPRHELTIILQRVWVAEMPDHFNQHTHYENTSMYSTRLVTILPGRKALWMMGKIEKLSILKILLTVSATYSPSSHIDLIW